MVHWDCSWDVDEDSRLLKGIYTYGMGNWEQIKMDKDFDLDDKVKLRCYDREMDAFFVFN